MVWNLTTANNVVNSDGSITTLAASGFGWSFVGAPMSAPIQAAAVPVSTGVSPLELNYSLYGHPIPASVGKRRIGGEIISGPWIEGGLATFCISFGVPFDPTGTCDIREIAFDSEVVWDTSGASGVTTSAGGTFRTEAFTFRFYQGTLTQDADPVEIARFGNDAVAYRPQILIWFENLPLAATKFKKIPYVSAVIGDSGGDDVNIGSALELLAYSPWVSLTSSEFETVGVTDGLVNGGMVIAAQSEFLQLIQQGGRFYTNWDILQTDKLRIVDRGDDVTADILLDKSRLIDVPTISRAEPNSAARELELSTIDPDADYTIVPSRAQRPRAPVSVTTSVRKDEAYLPFIMDSPTRTALVTYTKYYEEQARKKINFTAMAYGLELEPGALVAIDLGADFPQEVWRVVETLHGVNYTVEVTAESIMRCDAGEPTDPYLELVVLLMGFEDVDGASGAPGLTDESPAAHGTGTASPPGPAISTAQYKFGSSSLLLVDVPGNEVLFAPSYDWVLASSNSDQFTVEAWLRMNTMPGGGADYGCIVSGGLSVNWDFSTLGSGEFRFRFKPDGSTPTTVTSSGAALTTSVWYFLAVDKDATGKIRLYKDGVMVGSATPADSSIFNTFDDLLIGAAGLFGVAGPDGNIDELRITKGIARYASDSGFAVPTAAFPRT